jgi:cytochrome c-type biogenesis protein CcmH
MIKHRYWFLMFLLCSTAVWGAIDVHEFDNEVQRQRYLSFIEEMRCPKCQNQNLAGSDSPIANDLRRELYTLIMDGKSDREIVDFMVARYGEYILYRPRLSPATMLLWLGPVILLLIGIVTLILVVRQRRRAALEYPQTNAEALLSPEERERRPSSDPACCATGRLRGRGRSPRRESRCGSSHRPARTGADWRG